MHTGFVVTYEDGTQVFERDYYKDNKGQRKATNWSEIDQTKIDTIELYWMGDSKVSLTRKEIDMEEWYFTCSGVADVANPDRPKVIARNIGYKSKGLLYLFTVEESSGTVKTHTRLVR
jgi:hypothetical protein